MSDRSIDAIRILTIIFLTALLSLANPLSAADDPEEKPSFFDVTFGDFGEELETAAQDGKDGILIMFEMDGCPFCQRMRDQVLDRPEVIAYFRRHFKNFTVDIEGDVEVTDFTGQPMSEKEFALKSYRVRATPMFAFFDFDGNLVARFTGATRDADEFMLLGRYVVEKAYREGSFQAYKRGL